MENITTTNFADFDWRERKLACELLQASIDNGFPKDFWDDNVNIMLNKNSGNVFFTNADYQVAMINPDTGKLESFYYLPYSGEEGFANELKEYYEENKGDIDTEDIEYLVDIGIISEDAVNDEEE